MRQSSSEHPSKRLELLDFFTRWCVQCEMQRRNLERALADFGGRVRVRRVDAEVAQEMLWRYDVGEVPTLVVLADGAEAARLAGVQPPEVIAAAITRGLARISKNGSKSASVSETSIAQGRSAL